MHLYSPKSPSSNLIASSTYPTLQPSGNHLKACNIVVAHGGDRHAAYATQIYLYGVNFFLYAEKYNMTLWIDYKNAYNKQGYDAKFGENTWSYYLEEVTPESQGCNKNISNITVLSKEYVCPTLHMVESWAIHAFYYSQDHLGEGRNNEFDFATYYSEWYYNQRIAGYEIVSKYFRYKLDLLNNVNNIWMNLFGNNFKDQEILGVHMRGTDKTNIKIRRTVLPSEYLEYINNFVQYYGDKSKIFIATDDQNYLEWIKSNLSQSSIYYQTNIQRSDSKIPVFALRNASISKYAIGMEVMTDILLLSRCDWFIHSASAVAEAVFYNNIALHNKSVHLEYVKNRQIPIWFDT